MRVTGRSNEITVTSTSCVRAGRVAPGRWLWPLRPSSRPSSEAIRPSAAGWCDYGEWGQPASSNTCLLSQSPGRIHLSMEDPSLWTNCGSTRWSLTLVCAPLIFNQHFLLTFIFRECFKALFDWQEVLLPLSEVQRHPPTLRTTQVTWWGATGLRPVAVRLSDRRLKLMDKHGRICESRHIVAMNLSQL